ncbi:MAG: serine protease [Tannerella sp.]|jgi:tetratricopeptide (TPR) repeat protein|nr:serine protease [Tannerella sp.]
MKKYFVFLLSVCTLNIQAQSNLPRWVESARKAVFTIEAVDNKGNTRKGNGFFIQSTGEAVSDYTLFNGAIQATVTDTEGRKMQVGSVIGADNVYNVIRFKVTVPRSVPFLTIASSMPVTGIEAWLVPPAMESVQKGAIEEISKIMDVHDYFKINIPLTSAQVSLPLLTEKGEVFALTQADASGKNKTYGISLSYIQSLRITSKDILGKTYSSIGIRSGWAENVDEAQVALFFLSSQQDAPTYLETLNDFIQTFPNLADGYLSRASHYANFRNELAESQTDRMRLLELAMDDLNMSLKKNPKEDEGLYNQAKLIYEVLLTDSTVISKFWNIRTASEKLQHAINLNDFPVYRQLEGDIAFLQGDFQKAHDLYMHVNQSPYASSLSFYLATRTRLLLPDVNPSELISLMDSAVMKSMAIPSEAAAYIQESIDLKMQYGQYDAAVKDYDLLSRILSGNVGDVFYYYREQAKFRAGDFDGALMDIETAISLSPQEPLYYAEEASIYLRKQDPARAQQSVEKSLALDPEFTASHRLLGICLLRQQKKDDACKAFQKAMELGDPVAGKLIEDNCL